jgi:hypothetical protein
MEGARERPILVEEDQLESISCHNKEPEKGAIQTFIHRQDLALGFRQLPLNHWMSYQSCLFCLLDMIKGLTCHIPNLNTVFTILIVKNGMSPLIVDEVLARRLKIDLDNLEF